MATDVLLIKEGYRLGAADPTSAEVLEDFSAGEMVTATLRRTRNPGHHRKFMAMVGEVFKNQNKYATQKHMLIAIKIAIGLFDAYEIKGKMVPIPRSISFGNMDQTEFKEVYDKAVQHILEDIIPGLNNEELELRVLEIMEGRK